MAYWVHGAEPILLGHERKLYSAVAENLAQLHLECRAMYVVSA